MAKTGRGNKYTPNEEDLQTIKDLASVRCTERQIYRVLGIGHSTWHLLKSENSDVLSALELGEVKMLITVKNALFEVATGGNFQALKYILNNAEPELWAERTQTEHVEISLVDIAKRKAELRKRANTDG